MRILVLNGPNINLLGLREPGVYGSDSYADLLELIRRTGEEEEVETEVLQSNHEGDLVDGIQQALGRVDGLVLNPGAYTHTSIAMQAMASADYDYVPSMAVDPGAVPYTPSMALDPAMPTLLTPSFIRGDTAGILTPTATPMLLNPPPTTTAILTSIGYLCLCESVAHPAEKARLPNRWSRRPRLRRPR